jgi:hypothetical protein
MKTAHIKPGFCRSGMVFLIFFFMGFFQPAFAQTVKFGHVAPPFHGQAKGVDAFKVQALLKDLLTETIRNKYSA